MSAFNSRRTGKERRESNRRVNGSYMGKTFETARRSERRIREERRFKNNPLSRIEF
jgi:hypothetical protein